MIEPAVVLLRLLQYAGAMVLLGSSLLFLWAPPRSGTGSVVGSSWVRAAHRGPVVALEETAALGALALPEVVAVSLMLGTSFHGHSSVVVSFDGTRSTVASRLESLRSFARGWQCNASARRRALRAALSH